MKTSYKKLWKLLIDRDMTKTQLREAGRLALLPLQSLERTRMSLQACLLKFVVS